VRMVPEPSVSVPCQRADAVRIGISVTLVQSLRGCDDAGRREVTMARRIGIVGGWVLAVVGFGLALVSLAVPWATYRVSADVPGAGDVERSGGIAVFQLDRGAWYVVVLFVLLGLLAGAALWQGRAARAAGVAALLLAVAGMVVVNMLADRAASATIAPGGALSGVKLSASAAAGTTFGLVALPVLALGAALLSVRTPARAS
jgi:hypothetical protein